MEYSPEFPAGKSPRRELQGPRPAPLKVRKDSHKIKKPPVAPPHQQSQPPPQQHHHRPPVIIYTVSPKVIHANPSEFMTLVQRLTGATGPSSGSGSGFGSGSSSMMTSSFSSLQDNSGAVSPAARFASLEKTKAQEAKKQQSDGDMNMDMIEGVEINTGFFPGILSPGPGSLPSIPPNFFSPPSDPNPLNFFHDLSPVLHSSRNYIEGSFMPSPSNLLSAHIINSPTPSLDIFNNFFDL